RLRTLDPAAIAAHLDAENAHTAHRTAHLAELRSALARELTAPEPPTELFVPVRNGGWWYLDRPGCVAAHGAAVARARGPENADLRRAGRGLPVLVAGQLRAGGQMLVEDRGAVFAIALSAEHQLLARAEAGEGGCHITVVDLST